MATYLKKITDKVGGAEKLFQTTTYLLPLSSVAVALSNNNIFTIITWGIIVFLFLISLIVLVWF